MHPADLELESVLALAAPERPQQEDLEPARAAEPHQDLEQAAELASVQEAAVVKLELAREAARDQVAASEEDMAPDRERDPELVQADPGDSDRAAGLVDLRAQVRDQDLYLAAVRSISRRSKNPMCKDC